MKSKTSIDTNHRKIYERLSDLKDSSLSISDLDDRAMPDGILMCSPEFFEVKDVKNSFMEGNQAGVDKDLAKQQWSLLKEKIESNGCQVKVIDGVEGLEDMVFSANQALICPNKLIVPAKMKHASRQREIPFYEKWFQKNGYKIECLSSPETSVFEAHGDAIWHPEKKLLWGGYGQRTTCDIYREVVDRLGVPVIVLELVTETFYHLDTAFCTLDKDTVMIFEGAFSGDGVDLIKHMFSNVISAPKNEAHNFACNALAIGRHVYIEKGNNYCNEKIEELGFIPVEVETSEFKKSGGSVFCLTLDIYL